MFHHHIHDIPIREVHRFLFAEYLHEVLLQEKFFGEKPPTCHVLARVVGAFLQARVASGVFLTFGRDAEGKMFFINNEHSWIRLTDQWLMDVKPVGIVSRGPVLIWAKEEYPGSDWYHRLSYKEATVEVRTQKTRQTVKRLCTKLANYCQEHPFTAEMATTRFSTLI